MPASSQDGGSVQPVPSLRPMCGDGTEGVGPSAHSWAQAQREKVDRKVTENVSWQSITRTERSGKESQAGMRTE